MITYHPPWFFKNIYIYIAGDASSVASQNQATIVVKKNTWSLDSKSIF
jgi:hypothetical protein